MDLKLSLYARPLSLACWQRCDKPCWGTDFICTVPRATSFLWVFCKACESAWPIRTPHCGPEQHATLGALIFHHTQDAAMVLSLLAKPSRARSARHGLCRAGLSRCFNSLQGQTARYEAWGSKASRRKAATGPKLARPFLLSTVKERTERAPLRSESRKQRASSWQTSWMLKEVSTCAT